MLLNGSIDSSIMVFVFTSEAFACSTFGLQSLDNTFSHQRLQVNTATDISYAHGYHLVSTRAPESKIPYTAHAIQPKASITKKTHHPFAAKSA